MTIFEFLQELECFFPLNETEETVRKRIVFYTEILEGEVKKTGKSYDYRQITRWFLKHYKYKTFPGLANIIEALTYGEVKTQSCKDEGALLIITLTSGLKYGFTVSPIGKSINELKADIMRKFGNCSFKFYPKGTVIIGDKIFLPEE